MSKKFRCNNCGAVFDDPKLIETTYEDYNGVARLFGSKTPLEYYACPYCYDEDFDEIEDEEDEE